MATSPRVPGRAALRLGVAGVLALPAALALAGPASAHVEVESDTAQALAENVTLDFASEAESDKAGFVQMRVVLPRGIAPADVTLEQAPKGWKLKAGADGFTVAGPELPTGKDAEYKVRVRQLPDAKELAFKTIETYSDGKISRWIELPTGGEQPEQPAPILKLKAAAPGAKPLTPNQAASEPASPPASASASAPGAGSSGDAASAAADRKNDDGGSAGLVVGGVVVALIVLGGGAWWLAGRRTGAAGS
ncbi:hypothetical protein SZN_25909 [Streptomyces zinciresistens K42]|uniref:YncI copper-binding domain-containing protein n=1 Tax=Streptomyces zinciresistens K42 TaxID=700597 RepID=G2GI42_9ACTN|nr:DUF1775 domain-containing protein [Streptomyces zinciresistens]EGX56809.1 hypothetical protein SZN_25909 [Streptomyces zinciresistens K42]